MYVRTDTGQLCSSIGDVDCDVAGGQRTRLETSTALPWPVHMHAPLASDRVHVNILFGVKFGYWNLYHCSHALVPFKTSSICRSRIRRSRKLTDVHVHVATACT